MSAGASGSGRVGKKQPSAELGHLSWRQTNTLVVESTTKGYSVRKAWITAVLRFVVRPELDLLEHGVDKICFSY